MGKFSLKKYEKDKKKCYDLSRSGINLESLSQTEERISSNRIKTVIKEIHGSDEVHTLKNDAEQCNKKDSLGLCSLRIKDRNMRKCEYCEVNV